MRRRRISSSCRGRSCLSDLVRRGWSAPELPFGKGLRLHLHLPFFFCFCFWVRAQEEKGKGLKENGSESMDLCVTSEVEWRR